MKLNITLTTNATAFQHRVVLIEKNTPLSKFLSKNEEAAAKQNFEAGNFSFQLWKGDSSLHLLLVNDKRKSYQQKDDARRAANLVCKFLNTQRAKEASFVNLSSHATLSYAFAEGMALSNYQFLKYKTKDVRKNTLAKLHVGGIDKRELDKLKAVVEGNLLARDLINEPLSFLTAEQLSTEIQKAGKAAGFSVQVFNKKKIESLRMGGLLAVNRGSLRPPTFTILEYKPAKATNKKPIVLVGKGVVYDTGGLSLKPTANSMDMMKCDMSGAAAVVGTFHAIASMKLPVHIVGLIPATDNRPGEDAYVPGDVVPMMNGMNVEVLNTDAEGRMILADALAYASRYKPEMVFDFATLTGAAKAAIGSFATVCMGTASDAIKDKLKAAGNEVYEPLVEFPLWDEYGQMIKSDVADIKNVGGPEGGAITAGKFLECFTDYPWMHFDIAGPAYLMAEDSYRGKYGTGVGVRLMVEFLEGMI
ncbi:MAG: leucyl aminopeptidase [Chitinophagales bacterium]